MSTVPVAASPSAPDSSRPDSSRARAELVLLLQLAYSGELGATRAYIGHRHALRDAAERKDLAKIVRDEVRHRHCILRMLGELGSAPVARRERKMEWVGFSISVFCHVGGWFFPMYGAGKLEAQNVREYEHAARLAVVAGLERWVPEMLEMAEVEWDHERYFRSKAASHRLWRVMPQWPSPPPRESIRASFDAWSAGADRTVEPVRAPWLVR